MRSICDIGKTTVTGVTLACVCGWFGGATVESNAAAEEIRLPVNLVAKDANAPTIDETASMKSSGAIPLPPRGSDHTASAQGSHSSKRAITTTVTSLGVVLGLFLLLVWVQRKSSGRGSMKLPGNVIETLGRAPLNGRQEMQLVRVGNKLLLLSVTANSAETLTEITDPDEIDRLSSICEHKHAGSIAASFREILSQLNNQQRSGHLHASAIQ
jgi:flagellar biogenesis protein FliO